MDKIPQTIVACSMPQCIECGTGDKIAMAAPRNKSAKSSVASSTVSTAMSSLLKAIELDRRSMERNLVFLRRAIALVTVSCVVCAFVIMDVSNDGLLIAFEREGYINSEGDRTMLHTVRVAIHAHLSFSPGHCIISYSAFSSLISMTWFCSPWLEKHFG